MPATISPSSTIAARSSRARSGRPARTVRGSRPCRRRRERSALARYVDEQGRAREVVALSGFQGSALVVDRDAATATTIGAAIDQVLGNQAMRASAAQHSARLKATDPLAAAAALIEGLVESV